MKRSLPPLSPPFLACRHSRAPGAPSPAQHGTEDLSSCSSPLYPRQDPSVSLLGSPCLSLPCAVAVPPPGTLSGWFGSAKDMGTGAPGDEDGDLSPAPSPAPRDGAGACPQASPPVQALPCHLLHLWPPPQHLLGWRHLPWALRSSSRGASPPRWPLHSRQASLGGFR